MIVLSVIIGGFAVANLAEKEKQNKIKLREKIKSIDNFISTKTIESRDGSYILSFDDTNKKMAYVKSYYLAVINYDEIKEIELINNNEVVSSKSTSKALGRAVVGGVLLGGVGAIIGGVTGGNKNQEYASSVLVKIKTNNPDRAILKIETFNANSMYSSARVRKDQVGWDVYKLGMSQAKDIELKVNSIIDDNIQDISLSKHVTPSLADEILKLHTLLKGGVITQEEFDVAKSKLI